MCMRATVEAPAPATGEAAPRAAALRPQPGSASIQSPTTWLKRSGSSHIGQWPDCSKTTSSAARLRLRQPRPVGRGDDLLVGAPDEQRRHGVGRDELAVVLQRLVEQDARAGVGADALRLGAAGAPAPRRSAGASSISGTKCSMKPRKSSCAASSAPNSSSSGKIPSSQPPALRSVGPCETLTCAAMPVAAELAHEIPDHERPHRPADEHRVLERERVEQVLHVLRRTGRRCGRPRSPATRRARAGRRRRRGSARRARRCCARRSGATCRRRGSARPAGPCRVVVGEPRAVGKLVEARHGRRLCTTARGRALHAGEVRALRLAVVRARVVGDVVLADRPASCARAAASAVGRSRA